MKLVTGQSGGLSRGREGLGDLGDLMLKMYLCFCWILIVVDSYDTLTVECNQAFCIFSVEMYDLQSFRQKHIRINDGMIISCLKR